MGFRGEAGQVAVPIHPGGRTAIVHTAPVSAVKSTPILPGSFRFPEQRGSLEETSCGDCGAGIRPFQPGRDERVGTASCPASPGRIEVETADDFVPCVDATITGVVSPGCSPAGGIADLGGGLVLHRRMYQNQAVTRACDGRRRRVPAGHRPGAPACRVREQGRPR